MRKKQIKMYQNKIQLSILTIIGVIFAIIATRIAILSFLGAINYDSLKFSQLDVKIFTYIMAFAAFIFWGTTINAFIKLIKTKPVLQLNEDGIIEGGPLSVGFIPWDNIEKIAPFQKDTGFDCRNYLGIWVINVEELCKSCSIFKAELIKENVMENGVSIAIPEALLEEPLEITIERIHRFKRRVYDERVNYGGALWR